MDATPPWGAATPAGATALGPGEASAWELPRKLDIPGSLPRLDVEEVPELEKKRNFEFVV